MMKEVSYSIFRPMSALTMAIALFLMAQIVPAQTFGIDENFDELASSLVFCDPTAVPVPGCDSIPADLLGWTPTPPTGWTVTKNAAHTGVGCPEWDGWTFATNEFFLVAQQGREDFVHPGSIHAIADSDEFDDCGPGGAFDSTLSSPAVTIPAGATNINGSHLFDWRFEGSSIADVWYTIDGGAPIVIQHLISDSFDPLPVDLRDTVITYTIPTSASPQTVQLFFRYWNTQNNWWVAIDDVQLSWTATTPTPVVPAVTPWGLIVMAMLMLGAGALTLSRRKALSSC